MKGEFSLSIRDAVKALPFFTAVAGLGVVAFGIDTSRLFTAFNRAQVPGSGDPRVRASLIERITNNPQLANVLDQLDAVSLQVLSEEVAARSPKLPPSTKPGKPYEELIRQILGI